MKRIQIIIVLLILFFTTNCSLQYEVIHNKIDSIENPLTTDTLLFFKDGLFEVSIVKYSPKSTAPFFVMQTKSDTYSILTDFTGDLVFEADDTVIKLKAMKKPTFEIDSKGRDTRYIQIADAIITLKDLETLANAKKARIQIYGEPKEIKQEYLEFLKRFYNEYK